MEERKLEDECYLDVREAASMMRCSTMQIYRDCNQGSIPHIRKGKRIIFKKRELVTWLDLFHVGPSVTLGQPGVEG